MNIYNKNPEWVLEQRQLIDIKHQQGCAACEFRSRLRVFGVSVCGIENNYPGQGGFCNQWQYDEGVSDGIDSERA